MELIAFDQPLHDGSFRHDVEILLECTKTNSTGRDLGCAGRAWGKRGDRRGSELEPLRPKCVEGLRECRRSAEEARWAAGGHSSQEGGYDTFSQLTIC